MKRFLAFMLIFVCAIILIGCQKKETYEIAMVTDYGDITDQSFNQTTWEAVKAYAEKNDKTYAYYKPAGDSTAERVAKVEQAIQAGAKVVVMPGYAFAGTVYECQDEYSDVKFVALDVSEWDVFDSFYNHDASGNQTTLINEANQPHVGKNVVCIVFQEEEAGYLAGYAAVMDGETKLGFLGGMAVPAVQRYGLGYLQGIVDAAAIKKVNVEVWYAYGGQFFGDATITAAMEGWYTAGCQTVFACGGGIFTSVVSAIQSKAATTGKLIGVDTDQSLTVTGVTVLTSAMKGLTDATVTCLDEFYGSWTIGGKVLTYGLKTDTSKEYVGLPRATWTMKNFTLTNYDTVIAAIRAGSIVISSDITATPASLLVGQTYVTTPMTAEAFGGSLK